MDTVEKKAVFFQGKWKGTGIVIEKGIDYTEELTFTLLRTEPAIVVNTQSFTKRSDTGAPLHSENGFVKILPTGGDITTEKKVEASYSHPFSLNEFEYGIYKEGRLTIAAKDAENF